MALLKINPSPVKVSPTAKAAVSSPTGKSPPTMKKPVDGNSSLKKTIVPSSPIKMKTTPVPMKSPAKAETSPVKAEKSPSKVEKSPLKLTVTKANITSTIKTPPPMTKSPTTKTSSAETRTPIRNVIKPVTSKPPEQKQLGLKKEISIRSPEKLAGNKTNVNSVSTLKMSPKSRSPVKSASALSSPVKSISSPVKSISSPVKSVSSPTKLISSPVKSISSPVKSISSPTKSISSPTKSILSPLKPKTTREVKPSSTEKPKDAKTTQSVSSLSIKKPANLLKSPIKTISSSGKADSTVKSKLSTKNSPTSKTVKNTSTVSKVVSKPTTAENDTADVSNHSAVEKVDLCHCIDTMEKCDEISNTTLITEYTIDDNENFDVMQAFKVAEQLIQIQSNDRNLETIIETCENNSMVNWDDIITPCDALTVSNSSDETSLTSSEQICDIPSCNPRESISNQDSFIIEMTGLNYPCDSEILDTKPDENLTMIEFTDITDPSSISSECTEETEYSDENFTDEFSFKNVDDSIQNHCNENVLPEWTITIDEFSLDLSKKETQSPNIYEIMNEEENHTAVTPCPANLSYADVLKKIPKVLVNSTNVQSHCRKEPKLNINVQIKEYRMLKKVEALYSTDLFFNNIENNYPDCDHRNDYYEEPEYCGMRKKKCKKIKHLPKRHLRNKDREYEYIESQTDVFVTSVWKNIY